MPTRTADARWQGDLKSGNGNMRLGSGAFEGQFSFDTRFENGAGTNPEELIGAAHAGCYSMQFSAMLAGEGYPPDAVDTHADVEFSTSGTPTIETVALTTRGKVPGIDNDTFMRLAEEAKNACPVSRLFEGATITLSATLES
ncbi:OsmC family protein [Salinisphaera sp. USBA-960]|uniref:OsmC family protein n=1 Tax=Salinisphaera orenii TaxID=856731 RepID=UPI000DBE5F23|nr:OsmC family protein [Salifodinibacter halophilus]NNC25688.1 OsmC family protein [Salifodinibacter halophilus]